jgi:hypothetical protein
VELGMEFSPVAPIVFQNPWEEGILRHIIEASATIFIDS